MILYEHFHYEGVIAEDDIRSAELWVQARAVVGSERTHIVGMAPRIRFWREQMVLIAAASEKAPLKWYAYPVGDVILRAARAGDVLHASQDTGGQVRVWLLRKGQLLVAVGSLHFVDFGDPALWVEPSRAERAPRLGRTEFLSRRAEHLRQLQNLKAPVIVKSGRPSNLARFFERPPELHCIEVQIGPEWRTVGELRSVTLEGYDVFVATATQPGRMSIVRGGDEVLVNAARRSAVIMGFYLDSLRGERADGSFVRYPSL